MSVMSSVPGLEGSFSARLDYKLVYKQAMGDSVLSGVGHRGLH